MSDVPSSRDPLHPFIFVFELITVTFTSPLHLICGNYFWGDVIAAVEHGIGRFVLAGSSCVMFRIWTDLKLQALPPMTVTTWGCPTPRSVKT